MMEIIEQVRSRVGAAFGDGVSIEAERLEYGDPAEPTVYDELTVAFEPESDANIHVKLCYIDGHTDTVSLRWVAVDAEDEDGGFNASMALYYPPPSAWTLQEARYALQSYDLLAPAQIQQVIRAFYLLGIMREEVKADTPAQFRLEWACQMRDAGFPIEPQS